jgi:PTS system nitrogen regulatory IIA component
MDLKLKDVADLLNVSEVTIRRWLADGKIPAYRINNQYRFSREEIEDWVMKQKLPANKSQKSPATSESAEPANRGMQQFSLFRAIHKGGVLTKVPGNTKEEVIRFATSTIAKELNLDPDVLADLLIDRENLQPTALSDGIGIPHARDFLLNTPQDLVTVVFPEKPIAYGSLDGKPVHTLFFLFACNDKRHLHLLAKIAHFCNHQETQQFLRMHPQKSNLLDYIKNWESNLA